MKILIAGTGNVGLALASGWSKAGHEIAFVQNRPDSPKAAAAKAELPNATFGTLADLLPNSDVFVLSTPPEAVLAIAPLLEGFKGVVIDTTNAIRVKPEPHQTAFHAIKAIAKLEKVVKCFNTTGFENMRNPVYHGKGIQAFYSTDNTEAGALANQLAKDLGFSEAVRFGGDVQVALQEQFALAWINLAIFQGMGRDIAITLSHR